MRHYYFIFFLQLGLLATAQKGSLEIAPIKKDKLQGDDNVYVAVEAQAEFPGGYAALKQYLETKLFNDSLKKMLPETESKSIVYLNFIVEKSGKITNIKMLKGVKNCPACDQKCISIIKKMPDWKPAFLDGKIVRSLYNLPVRLNFN